ncbi:cyclin [Phyllosticta citribraziliensis]|uniref:Cyclin n=1 Tax=Phyllosticta citribraziliensis TaxID=989973 RepID=A0ABR1M919_9PEZI
MAYTSFTPEQNAQALDFFIQLPVSKEMVAHLAAKASEVIRCEPAPASSKQLPPTPPATPPQNADPLDRRLPSVEAFITSLVERSHVGVATLMTSLVYLARLKSRLPNEAKGMRCTVHRIFLASLILAAKNLNDSSPKNKHWARYTTVRGFDHFGFSLTEVNLMEKQLLFLLDWELRVSRDDLYQHLDPFLAPIRDYQIRVAEKARNLKRARQLREVQGVFEQYGKAVPPPRTAEKRAAPYSTYRLDDEARSIGSASRASSRMPSLSPPRRSDSASSTHSTDADDVSSDSSTPSSSYDGDYCAMPQQMMLRRYDTDLGSDVVHIQPPPKAYKASYGNSPLGHGTPASDYDKPSKKIKTGSSSLISRFLGNAGFYRSAA